MRSRVRYTVLGLLVALLVCALSYLIYSRLSVKSAKPPKAPRISLIPSTPPPPPPPPKEEKKPEPPKEQKEVKVDPTPQVKDAPQAPPSPELKMEGPAGDGPSAFTAGKVTREEVVPPAAKSAPAPAPPLPPVLPKAASGLFNPLTNYANGLKGEVQRFLARNKELRQRAYKVELHLWVDGDGQLTRHELIGSSGDDSTDDMIRQAMVGMGRISMIPPQQMPQPIRLSLATGGR
jgi:periplasmic protein TonB